jgi:TP901 family phage tail tape measure protein
MAFEEIGAKLVVEGEQAFFRTLGRANTDLGQVGATATDAGRGFLAFGNAALSTGERIDSLTKKIDLQQRQYDLLKKDVKAASDQYGDSSQQAAKKQLALDKLGLSIEGNQTQLKALNRQLEAEQQELGQSADAANQVTSSNQKIDDSLKTTGGSFNGFREIATGAMRYVGEVAVQMAAQAGQAIVGFVGDSITAAGDFQAGMNNFAAVTNIDTSGLEEFRDLFLDLGAELPVSTAEVQQAATELAKGGIEPATIAAGGLESALRFAGAAGLELADAATIAAKVVGGWTDVAATAEEKARFMAEAMDLITKAANASTVDADELALGLYNVQGAAQNAGLEFQETVTTLAAVSSVFNSSAEAGNSFKNFIARLQPTTKPATEAMSQLGLYGFDAQRALAFLAEEGVVPLGTSLDSMGDPLEEIDAQFRNYITSTTGMQQGTAEFDHALGELNKQFSNSAFYDAEGRFIGMAAASELLQEKTKDLTDEQKASTLQAIFGNDAMGVAARLAMMGAEGYDAMAASMEAQAGVQATAAIKQQGFNVALDNFKGSVEALQISLGSYLLPVLESLFNDYLSPGINTIRDFTTAMFDSGDPFGYIISQINTVIPGFQTFIGAAQSVASFIADNFGPIMAGALGILAATLYTVVIPAFTAWAASAIAAATATMIALAPIVIPIAAIGLAVGALYAAWDSNFLGIKDALTGFWNSTGQPIFETLRTWLAQTLTVAIQRLSDYWNETLQPALRSAWAFIDQNVIPIMVMLGRKVFADLGAAIGTLAGFWTNTLQPALSAVWSFLNTYLIPIFQAIYNVQIAAMNLALTALAGIFQNVLLPAGQIVVGLFVEHLRPAIEYVSGTLIPALQATFAVLVGYWQTTLGPILQVIAGYFQNQVAGAVRAVTDAIRDAISWLNDLAEGLRNIKLPDWMTPGSPTPWENGLRGVNEAMKQLASEGMPQFESRLAMLVEPQLVQGYTPANMLAGQMASNVSNVTHNFTQNVQTTSATFAAQSYALARLRV